MKSLYQLLARIGSALDPVSLILLILVLNVSWTLTLNMFGQHFKTVAGSPLLDLQNVSSILSVQQAMTLISSYGADAKSLYWTFFIMDNIMPPLVFGSFALLWAKLFSASSTQLLKYLFNSPILLLPLGVGLFDWFENLAFITALGIEPNAGGNLAMQIGLIFVHLKALCLFATFGLTMIFVLYSFIMWVVQRIQTSRVKSA